MTLGLEKQTNRRWVVVFCYAMIAALIGVFLATDYDWGAKWVLLALLIATATGVAVAILLLSRITTNYVIAPPDLADERQARVRDAAYREAYLYFSGGMVVFALYTSLATSKKLAPMLWIPSDPTDWQVVSSAIIFTAATLPQAIIAWKEPDVPAELPEEA